MELSRPLAVVTPSVDGDVLRVLALADTDFTPGDVHELLGRYSIPGVRRSLERLATQGIVTRRAAGRAYLFGLNRDHLGADPIIALARSRERLLERLAEETRSWSEVPVYGAVFGSAARADHRVDSDLDILLVHPLGHDADVWANQVVTLSRHATAWTGNDARVLSYGPVEVMDDDPPDRVLHDAADEGLAFVGDPGWLRRTLRQADRRRRSM